MRVYDEDIKEALDFRYGIDEVDAKMLKRIKEKTYEAIGRFLDPNNQGKAVEMFIHFAIAKMLKNGEIDEKYENYIDETEAKHMMMAAFEDAMTAEQ